MGCGCFSAGIESFDFLHPGWCDNCYDQLDHDDDGEEDYDPAEYYDDDFSA